MAARLFFPPVTRAFSTAGTPAAGELLYFYLTGGTTATPIYTTSALTPTHSNPVVADSAGRFPAIYLSDAIAYRAVQKTAAGVTVSDVDPYVMPIALTAEDIRDTIGVALVAGSNVTVVVNDPGDSITVAADLSNAKPLEAVIVPITDTTVAVSAGVNKFKFRAPFVMTIIGARAGLDTAQVSGSVLTVDINENGVSILSTKMTFDNTEKTTFTAVTQAVLSDTAIADDAEISFDVDQIGDGTAKGLNVMLLYRRT